jgi:hypothetical protein
MSAGESQNRCYIAQRNLTFVRFLTVRPVVTPNYASTGTMFVPKVMTKALPKYLLCLSVLKEESSEEEREIQSFRGVWVRSNEI